MVQSIMINGHSFVLTCALFQFEFTHNNSNITGPDKVSLMVLIGLFAESVVSLTHVITVLIELKSRG